MLGMILLHVAELAMAVPAFDRGVRIVPLARNMMGLQAAIIAFTAMNASRICGPQSLKALLLSHFGRVIDRLVPWCFGLPTFVSRLALLVGFIVVRQCGLL